MTRTTFHRELPFAVFLLATLPYANGLRNGFTFDDVPIAAENPRIRSFARLGDAVTTDWWNGTRPQSLAYRPLMMATLAIDYTAATYGEAEPLPARLPARMAHAFHVQNVLWHGAASVALFFLILALFTSPGLAFAAAALFAVHPVHTEAVDGIVGRAELMSACFALLALLVAWRVFRDDPPGFARPLISGALLLAALLSKESAIVIPVIPLAWLLARAPEARRALLTRSSVRRLLAALAVAAIVYLAARSAVLGSPLAGFATAPGAIVVDNPIAGATGTSRWLTPVRVFGEAVRVLVYPARLSADYSYDQIPLVTSLDGGTLLCGLALIGLATAVYLARRRAPAIGFGLALFLLAWVLTSNLPVVIGTIFGERLLYLPSAGVCLAIASALITMGRRVPLPGAAAVAIAALVVLCGARTWARNPEWKDGMSLFEAAATSSPRSVKALNGYASELFTAGRPQDAIVWAERALAIYPSYTGAHQTLGKSLRVLANDEPDPTRQAELRASALEHAQKLIELFRSSAGGGNGLADAWNLRGSLALDRGDVSTALDAFGKSRQANPSFVPSIVGAGVALAMQGDREGALERFDRALALDPGNAEAAGNAAMLRRELAGDPAALANQHGLRATQLLQEKRLPEALAEFREAARLQPTGARAYLGIGTVLAAQAEVETDEGGKRALIDEAVGSFEHALAVEPDNADAHRNLGIVYLGERREPAKVAEHFRAYLRLVPGSPQRARMEETIRRMDSAAGARRP